jgi:hypothetical protein
VPFQGEIRLGELLSPPERAHGGKGSGKKRTPEFRHRDRIPRRGNNGYGKDADRKIGGPRYLHVAPAVVWGQVMNTLNDVLGLEPEKLDAHWGEVDRIVFTMVNPQEQIDAWEKVLSRLQPTDLSKGHPYFRLGVLHLLVDRDEAAAISYLEQAYAEDKRFSFELGIPAQRQAAYRVLALVKGFFQYLPGLGRESRWQLEQLNAPHRRVLVQTLLTLYDATRPHVLDMKSYTYQEFFSLIEERDLLRFAIENYYCALDLLELFFLENQHIDRIRDEYPLSRAIVGLFGGVIEAILASRLQARGRTLGQLINEGHSQGLIRVGTRLAALCSLILYLRNHVHADRAANQSEFFIDINVAKGCKAAMDWTISELLQQSG